MGKALFIDFIQSLGTDTFCPMYIAYGVSYPMKNKNLHICMRFLVTGMSFECKIKKI